MIPIERYNGLLSVNDLLISPFYFLIIVGVLFYLGKGYQDPWLKKTFIKFGVIKLFASIAFALLYHFVYGGGDTSAYWYYGKIISASIKENFFLWIKMVFRESSMDNDTAKYLSFIRWYTDKPSFFVCRMSALFSPFTFGLYVPTSFIFATLSHISMWKIFLICDKLFPNYRKKLIIPFFIYPSVVFWSSGIMKDTVVMIGLGFFIYGFVNLFIFSQRSFKVFCNIGIGGFFLLNTKIYVFIVLMPLLIFYWVYSIKDKIQTPLLRTLLIPILIVFSVPLSIFSLNQLSSGTIYEVDNLEKTSKAIAITANDIYYRSGEQGSRYSLGTLDGSLNSVLSLLPAAINVALFRPYLWEAKNITMMLSALETTYFMLILALSLYKAGLFKAVKLLTSNSFLIFCILFSVILGLVVGITSFNFGTLVRYRLPMLPFLFLIPYLVQYLSKKSIKKIAMK